MNNEPWVVKTRSGQTWGRIRKLIIDSASRQIVSVDVIRDDTNRFTRVPWNRLEFENEDIVLGASEEDHMTWPSEGSVPDTVTLEESSRAYPS